jgi:putative phosphoesterase
MRIGVIADTHIPNRAREIPLAVKEAFLGTDLILHAGDLVVAEVLAQLRQIAPVEAVAGNNDPEPLALDLGLTRELLLLGYRIGMTHGHVGQGKRTVDRALSHFSGFDCVIFGHSDIAYLQQHGPTLAFNPGSATDRRRSPQCSYGLLHITSAGLRAEVCHLP